MRKKRNFYNTLVELGKNKGYQTIVQQHFFWQFCHTCALKKWGKKLLRLQEITEMRS